MTRRRILRSIIQLLFKLLSRVTVSGLEYIPTSDACILAINHLSRLDAPLIFHLIYRDDLTGLAADTYKQNLFFRWLVESVDGIWLNRGEADVHALREARNYLRAGWALGIAPEGTRSRTGGLIPAKTGVAYLADKTGVPLVPLAISGTENALALLLRFHRPRIQVCVGEPFHLPHIHRQSREADLQRNTDEIMCRIAALLPAEYRGAYADHPRLQELLQG